MQASGGTERGVNFLLKSQTAKKIRLKAASSGNKRGCQVQAVL